MMEKTKRQNQRETRLKLPVPFEEAVADVLKVKPPPNKKRRGASRRKTAKERLPQAE